MSDEPDHRPDEEAGEHGAAPDGDRDGLGLTEEFARIEAEIEAEIDEEISEELPAAVSGNPGEQEEPPPVRFDETDESDVPAAVPMAGATEEWQPENEPPAEQEAPGGGSAEDAEQEETDLAGGEADPPEPPPEPQAPDGMPEDEEEPATAFEADAPAEEHTVVRPGPAPRPGGAVPLGAAGPARGDVEVEERPRSLWWRFLTGSVLIVLSTATAVALSTLVFFTDLARDLQPISNIKGDLTEIDPGDPQTILIVGSDERSDTPGDPGRSDTTMLLRVDAENEVLSLFSLPRDLKVDIAGDKSGVGKLNEAYTYGGISKTLKTV